MQAHLDTAILAMRAAGRSYAEAVRDFRKAFVGVVLKDKRGNQCKAADALGLHRNTLSRTLHELELDPAEFRPALSKMHRR